MKYIGSLSGYGTLTWVGSGSCAVRYEIEAFYQDRGDRIKAHGQVSGLMAAITDIADRGDVRLALEDGRNVEVCVVHGGSNDQDGTLDIDILTALHEFTSAKPKPRPSRGHRGPW